MLGSGRAATNTTIKLIFSARMELHPKDLISLSLPGFTGGTPIQNDNSDTAALAPVFRVRCSELGVIVNASWNRSAAVLAFTVAQFIPDYKRVEVEVDHAYGISFLLTRSWKTTPDFLWGQQPHLDRFRPHPNWPPLALEASAIRLN